MKVDSVDVIKMLQHRRAIVKDRWRNNEITTEAMQQACRELENAVQMVGVLAREAK